MTSHTSTMLVRLCLGLLVVTMLSAPGAAEEKPPVDATPEPAEPVEPEEFTDDLVILKSELAVEGKVIRKTRDAVYVLVDYGVLSIPRSKIRSIELNMKSRLSALEEGDNVGRYRVALAALEEGNFLQAEDVLKGLIGKEGVPPEIHRKLAGIYETRGDLAKALEHWKVYGLARPDDKEAKKRIAELEKELGPTATTQPKPGNGGPAVAKPKPKNVEGLEAQGKWMVQHWGNKAVLNTTDLEGNKVLSLEIAANGPKDKTAISRPGLVNLAGKSKFAFRIFSAEKGRVEVALAVETPAGWFESRPVSVRPDWNTGLSVDLRSSRFKSKTKWRFETRIVQPEAVKQIHLLVYCGRRKALLYFDGIIIE